jgi:hypothetical protein
MLPRRALLSSALVVPAAAWQQAQNPSPMVEHTRFHPRVKQETPAGRRERLDIGTLFLPASQPRRSSIPLLFFFHGGTWLPELAAARMRWAVVTAQLGSGSGVYARAFESPARFADLTRQAESVSGMRFRNLALAGWSAGCGAIREILKHPANYERVTRILCIDGIHTGYVNGQPGPLESQLETANLEIFVQFARDAMAGRKRFLITHSEIFPGTFASTTETADWILRQINLRRTPVVRWGPMGTQQLSKARHGRFLLIGYAGNSAPDHVDQLHSLQTYWTWIR